MAFLGTDACPSANQARPVCACLGSCLPRNKPPCLPAARPGTDIARPIHSLRLCQLRCVRSLVQQINRRPPAFLSLFLLPFSIARPQTAFPKQHQLSRRYPFAAITPQQASSSFLHSHINPTAIMRFAAVIFAGLAAAAPQVQPISQISDGQIQAPPATSVAVPAVSSVAVSVPAVSVPAVSSYPAVSAPVVSVPAGKSNSPLSSQ